MKRLVPNDFATASSRVCTSYTGSAGSSARTSARIAPVSAAGSDTARTTRSMRPSQRCESGT